MAEPTVAVLGTGRMGSAMAARLRGTGFAVVVYNRTPDRARELAERIGATRRATRRPRPPPGADVVITMVADDAAVRDAVSRAGRRPGGPRARRRGGRHEHGPARHDPVARAGGACARRRHPRRAGLGQRRVDADAAS